MSVPVSNPDSGSSSMDSSAEFSGRVALVTGASGFVGYNLCRYLEQVGYYVRGVDIREPEFGPVVARDDPSQRGLAGAVLTDQGMDLTGTKLEIDVIECGHAREPLDDASELEEGRRTQRSTLLKRSRMSAPTPCGVAVS